MILETCRHQQVTVEECRIPNFSPNAEEKQISVTKTVTKQTVSISTLSQQRKEIHLQVESSKKSAILTTLGNSARVNVVKLNKKGDALIHDGNRIMMVAAKNVTILSDANEIGAKRLEFVKKTFSLLTKGEAVDIAKIISEAQKWLI